MQEQSKAVLTLKTDEINPGDFVYVSICLENNLYREEEVNSGYGIVLDKNPDSCEYLIPMLYKVLLCGKVFWCLQNEICKIYSG